MEKQTKNIITREWVEKELHFYNTANIKSTLVLCGALSLFFLPITIGIIYAICALIENILLKIVLSAIIGAITSVPIWIKLLCLRGSLTERKLLKNGDFDIVIRDVQYKSEKLVHRHTEKFLHFNGFKEISVGNVNYDLVSQGDEFYIVHYKNLTTIELLYSLKMYEYKEI